MKVLFVGPTLYKLVRDRTLDGCPEIERRPPAGQGDIARAVLDGATVIGLVDGRYEDVAAPWHKEILYAIQEGVTVLGAGSLGALRAAECAAFGMIGIGRTFQRYASGELVDDSDVAQLHGPDEIGSLPLTEAFVNVEATIDRAVATGELPIDEANRLKGFARGIFFKELCFETLATRYVQNSAGATELRLCLERNRVDAKRRDALELVEAMAALPARRRAQAPQWRLAMPAIWVAFISNLTPRGERISTQGVRVVTT